ARPRVNREDGADGGKVQGGCGARLAMETRQSLAVSGDFLGKELQRDKAPELAVLSLIDDAHPTAAQPFSDAIVGYDLCNHERRKLDNTEAAILGGIRGAVKRHRRRVTSSSLCK